jgi:hypothetical protein
MEGTHHFGRLKMGVDLYVNFKEPLTAEDIAKWSGEALTEDGLKVILDNINKYHNERDYYKQSDAWDVCHETKISSFVFNFVVSPDDLTIACLNRRWWWRGGDLVKSLLSSDELDVDGGVPYCGELDHERSKMLFAFPHTKEMLGDNFPSSKVDHIHWG